MCIWFPKKYCIFLQNRIQTRSQQTDYRIINQYFMQCRNLVNLLIVWKSQNPFIVQNWIMFGPKVKISFVDQWTQVSVQIVWTRIPSDETIALLCSNLFLVQSLVLCLVTLSTWLYCKSWIRMFLFFFVFISPLNCTS